MSEIYFTEKDGKKRIGVIGICGFCKNSFIAPKRKPYECCSHDCKNKLKTLRSSAKCFCAFCKKEFAKVKSSLANSKSGLYFCSRKCKDDAQKIGGVQEIMPPHYGRSNGKNVYKNLIENTCSPTCIGCSEINKYLLCVHHIDGNRNNNALSNLEIVCGNCHIKRHLKLINGEWVYDCDYLTDRDLLCML